MQSAETHVPFVKRRLVLAAVLAASLGVLAATRSYLNFDFIEHRTHDFLRTAPLWDLVLGLQPQPRPAGGAQVTVIAVDNQDILRDSQWPIDGHRRRVWARTIRKLAAQRAKVIVLDMFFTQPSGDDDADRELADAMRQAGNVVLACFAPVAVENSEVDAGGRHRVPEIQQNFSLLGSAAAAIGHANITADTDQVVRKVPVLLRHKGDAYWSLAIEAIRSAERLSQHELSLSANELLIADRRVPLDGRGSVWFDYRTFVDDENLFPLRKLLDDQLPPQAIAGKFVVVGLTRVGDKNTDSHPTPFGRRFGVLIQASTIANLLEPRQFRRATAWEETLLFAVLGVVSVLWFSLQKRWTSLGALLLGTTLLWVAGRLLARDAMLLMPIVAANGFLVWGFGAALVLDLSWWQAKARRGGAALRLVSEAGRQLAGGAPVDVNSLLAHAESLQLLDLPENPGAAIQRTLRAIMDLTGAKRGYFCQPAVEGKLTLLCSVGVNHLEHDACLALAERLAERNEPFLSSRARSNEQLPLPAGARQCLGLPIALRGALAGVFAFLDKAPSAVSLDPQFGPEDLQLATAIAFEGVVAHQNAQLVSLLQSAQLDTVLRLSIAAEYRDQETGQHIQRIRDYSAALARAAGLTAAAVELLRNSSAMHDIGKLAIPDSILNKPGRLTADERAVMQQHTVIGAKLLSGSSSVMLQASEIIAISHHEWFNGQGYPNKLSGSDIPLFGRIVSIADVYDAMTSKRCYKDAISPADTLQVLRTARGTQFDPMLLDKFLDIADEIRKIGQDWRA